MWIDLSVELAPSCTDRAIPIALVVVGSPANLGVERLPALTLRIQAPEEVKGVDRGLGEVKRALLASFSFLVREL